jgi:hypothetical protein
MMRRLSPVAGFFVLLSAVVAFGDAAGRPDPSLVHTLDRTFQSRFETIDGKMFGVERAAHTPAHAKTRRFLPKTASDKRLTGQLKEAGWDLVFFVAGRDALYSAEKFNKDPKWAEKTQEPVAAGGGFDPWDGISEPVHLTGVEEKAWELGPQLGMRLPPAFTAFAAKKRSYDFTLKEWTVIARPIPASKGECLCCHLGRDGKKRLKLGDTLGVAFYVFRPATSP